MLALTVEAGRNSPSEVGNLHFPRNVELNLPTGVAIVGISNSTQSIYCAKKGVAMTVTSGLIANMGFLDCPTGVSALGKYLHDEPHKRIKYLTLNEGAGKVFLRNCSVNSGFNLVKANNVDSLFIDSFSISSFTSLRIENTIQAKSVHSLTVLNR